VTFLLVGLITWQWFINTTKHSMNSILGNGRLMTLKHIPKIIFPSVVIVMDMVKFSIVLLLLVIYLWFDGFILNSNYIALPIVLLTELCFIVSMSYLVAALIPFLPDLKFIIDVILQLAFFLSGIVFSGSSIPDEYQFYFYLNPMANIIESYRDILMYNQWPDFTTLFLIMVLSLVVVYLVNKLLYQRFEYYYPRLSV
jgi:lipopolysaccharide transport system permease protein